MSLKTFIWDTISEGKNPSSKRLAGIIGWLVSVFVMIYCTLQSVEAPEMVDIFIICTVTLLGVDSVVNIFKKTVNKSDKPQTNN